MTSIHLNVMYLFLGSLGITRANYECEPYVGDLNRFPPATVCYERYELAVKHKFWLETRQKDFSEEEFTKRMKEVEYCCEAWRLLEEANKQVYCDWGYIPSTLRVLRKHIGDKNYFHARMPHPIPINRIRYLER